MRASQFAIATANLARQNAFLFLATHGPMRIASSSASTLLQYEFQYCPGAAHHATTRCENDRYEVYTRLLA